MVAALRATPTVVFCHRCGTSRAPHARCEACRANGADRGPSDRKRLVADRFRRIWAIVEVIADEPGRSRRELADRFHLSERQVQADLRIISCDMRLPLVRRQGYRFVCEGEATGPAALTLQDAMTLVAAIRCAVPNRGVPSQSLDTLTAKLPRLFPPHLQPLAALLLDTVRTKPGRDAHVMAALTDGILQGRRVRLSYPRRVAAVAEGLDGTQADPDRVLVPEMLFPLQGSWYVLGCVEREGGRVRSSLLPLGAVEAVTLVAAP